MAQDPMIAAVLETANSTRAEMQEVRRELKDHMRIEEAEQKDFRKEVNANFDAFRAELSGLTQSIASWMEKEVDYSQAFPTNKRGGPDLDGHREHHEELIDQSEIARERAEKLKTAWIDRAGWALIVLICVAIWEYIKANIK